MGIVALLYGHALSSDSPPPAPPARDAAPASSCATCGALDPRAIVERILKRAGLDKAGDERTGLSGALDDANDFQPGILERADTLARIDDGTLVPARESRLGAYAATAKFPPGTVGNAVHRAIGTIYGTLGTFGEERIGLVFHSPEAQALMNDPVDSPSSQKIASIEHAYWSKVRSEDPFSAGGQLGSLFSPASRDFLQRNIFYTTATR